LHLILLPLLAFVAQFSGQLLASCWMPVASCWLLVADVASCWWLMLPAADVAVMP